MQYALTEDLVCSGARLKDHCRLGSLYSGFSHKRHGPGDMGGGIQELIVGYTGDSEHIADTQTFFEHGSAVFLARSSV